MALCISMPMAAVAPGFTDQKGRYAQYQLWNRFSALHHRLKVQ
jgi:hypothetical protein